MPVQTDHPLYKDNIGVWQELRVVAKGQRSVKARGRKLLPILGGQSTDQYNAYLQRASFFNATGRTVDGIAGVVFRKDPIVTFPDRNKDFLDSVSLTGSPFPSFANRVFRNVIIVGRHGVLLDMETSSDTMIRPYMASYDAESIKNWRMEFIGGKTQLSLVVLQEDTDEVDPKDSFARKKTDQLRVLKLVEPNAVHGITGKPGILNDKEFIETESPVYIVEIWQKNPNKTTSDENKYLLKETLRPEVRGVFIDFIPFVFFGPTEPSVLLQRSMIEDLVDVNLSHYHSSADIEHGRHFTALPTAWVAGFPLDTELLIGSETAWVTDNVEARAGFMEYTGQGLGAIETALETKEQQMAILGARMLEAPRKAVESADTHRQRQAGEGSVVAAAAVSVEAGFTVLLKWAAVWLAASEEDVDVIFNKDFMPVPMAPQMLTVLMLALQSNKISWETYAWNLQRGELLPEGRTIEEERELIMAGSGSDVMELDDDEKDDNDNDNDDNDDDDNDDDDKEDDA